MHGKNKQRMVEFKDWSEDALRSIKAQTLLVIGDKDVVSPEHATEMHRLIPNSRLCILPGGHGDYIEEITAGDKQRKLLEACVDIIEEFLK